MTLKSSLKKVFVHLGSLKLTAFCLGYIIILIILGTVLQAQYGIFIVQEKIFKSWICQNWLNIPFFGLYSMMSLLLINVTCGLFLRRNLPKKRILSLIFIHGSLFLFCLSGLLKNLWTKETHITLKEGESINYSISYYKYELAIWENNEQSEREIRSLKLDDIKQNQTYTIPNTSIKMKIQTQFSNSTASSSQMASNYTLNRVPIHKNPEKNIPALIVSFNNDNNSSVLHLYGLDPQAQKIPHSSLYIQLRHQHHPLPFTVELKDVQRELYPNSSQPKTYQSQIIHQHKQFFQPVLIKMNHPFHFKNWTLYQSGYEKKDSGEEISTLALVYDPSKSLPYGASLLFICSFLSSLFFRLKNLFKRKKAKDYK